MLGARRWTGEGRPRPEARSRISRNASIEIVADAPIDAVWRVVSEWRIRLEPVCTGTRIVQEYTVVNMPHIVERLLALAIPAHRDRSDALRDDLRRLGCLAANPPADPKAHATPASA